MTVKKAGLIVVGIAMAMAGVGGAGVYLTKEESPAVKIADVKKMTETEQQAFLDELLMKVSEGRKPSDVEAFLAESINGLSKENASEAVYLLMSSLALEQGDQMSNYRTVGEGVLTAYNNDEFKTGRGKSFGNVADKSVQGFLEELSRQHLYLEDDGQGLYLSQDLDYISEAYAPYLNDTLKGVLEIRTMNQERPYVNGGKTDYDMELMIERILFIEGEKENWFETIYQGEMLALQEQAYMDFFGVSHDTYFDEVDGKLVMKEAVIEKMYLLQAEYANSFVGKEIIGYMAELEEDGFEKNDTQNFAISQMIERFAVDSDIQAPIIVNQDGGEAE